MIMFINTLFWTFFFMIGFTSISDRLVEMTRKDTKEQAISVKQEFMLVIYASATLGLLRILHYYSTTSLWTMLNLQLSIVVVLCFLLRSKLAILILYAVTAIVFFGYGSLTFYSAAAMILAMIILYGLNVIGPHLSNNGWLHFGALTLFGIMIWLLIRYFYHFSYGEMGMQMISFITVNTIAYHYSKILTRNKEKSTQLVYETQHDQLTHIKNRAKFETDFLAFFETAQENLRVPMTVAILDIDHFKVINDTYGHPIGDVVLRDFANQVEQFLKQRDSSFECYRTGGEEFHVIFPAVALNEGIAILSDLQRELVPVDISDELQITITISAGLTLIKAEDKSMHDTIQRADDTLYSAKRGGRNLVLGK